jgi:hypothetical protein
MTDLWKFFETPIIGGSSDGESSNETSAIGGGMSVSEFLSREMSGGDSQRFAFFADLTVPLGLVYLPPCNETNGYDEDSSEPKEESKTFDKMFSLISTPLGKNGNRNTRKKI